MTRRPGRRAAAAALCLVLSASVASPAIAADNKPTPAASVAGPLTLREATALWVASTKVYKAALANRAITLRAINEAFAKAVARAKAEYETTQFRAAAPAMSNSAAARYKEAVERAAAVRQAAIDALPTLPANPGPKPTLKSLAKSAGAASGTLD